MKNQSTICPICKLDMSQGKVFKCEKCEKQCHQACFIYTDEEIKNYRIKRCDVCRTLDSAGNDIERLVKEVKCVFCLKTDGILKKLKGKKDKWTHIGCVKWFIYVRLDLENGFSIFKTEKSLPNWIWTEECSICKKTTKGDFFIKCNRPNCEKYFHTRCIPVSLVEEIKTQGGISYTLCHCEEHKNMKKNGFEVKTYGKSLNATIESPHKPTGVKVLKNLEDSKVVIKDVILNSFKPVIINDEENKINKLKIKMKFTEETISSNGSVNFGGWEKKDNTNKNSSFIQKYKGDLFQDGNDDDKDFVFTYAKCDICAKMLENDDKEKIKQCGNCLVYYHIHCAKDFGDKVDSDFCRKCQNDVLFEHSCLVCCRFQGSMIKCDNNWVHIFCMVILKNYFYKKHDHMFNWGLDKYKVNKLSKMCQICKVSNTLVTRCQNCEIYFHPYCGLISNFDFYTIDKKANGPTDLLNRFEINFTCENHFVYVKGENRIIRKENSTTQETILQKNHVDKINKVKPSIQTPHLPLSDLIFSFNYRKFRKLTAKNDIYSFLKIGELNWDISEAFFVPVDERFLKSLESETKIEENTIEDLISSCDNKKPHNINGSNFEKENFIFCEFKNVKLNYDYLALFDCSKFPELKLNPNYINFIQDIQSNDNKSYNFIRKRKRYEEKENTMSSTSILSKTIKIVEEDEERFRGSFNYGSHSNADCSTNSTKLKLAIDDEFNDKATITESQSSINSKEELATAKLSGSYSNSGMSKDYNQSKFMKKLTLVKKIKLRRRERLLLSIEETAKQQLHSLLKDKSMSIYSFDEIDQELLMKSHMLCIIKNKNSKIMINLTKKLHIEPEYKYLDVISTYKSVTKWGNVKRRLKKGVDGRTIEDIIKQKGQNFKAGKTISQEKEEYSEYLRAAYEELKMSDSECCVCFFSDSEDTMPIVFCDSCNVSVHAECYGIKEIPEGDYFCDVCTIKRKSVKKCVLCLNERGALKKIDKSADNWVHVTCVMMSETVKFKDFYSMEEITGYKVKSKTSENNINCCMLCKSYQGDLFRCSSECDSYFHFFCAYLNGLFIRIEENYEATEKYYKKLHPSMKCVSHEPLCYNRDSKKQLRNLTYHKEFVLKEVENKISLSGRKHSPNSEYRNKVLSNFNEILNTNEITSDSHEIELMNVDYINQFYQDETKCSICLLDVSSEDELVTKCSKCTIKFHNKCYPSFENLSTNLSRILCDYCKIITKSKSDYNPPECLLCPNLGGAYKRCSLSNKLKISNSWIHVICAIYTKEIHLNKNVYEGVNNLVGTDKFNKHKCNVCHSTKGIVVKCCVLNCTNIFHSFCGFYNNHKQEKIANRTLLHCRHHTELFNKCTENLDSLINSENLQEIINVFEIKEYEYDHLKQDIGFKNKLMAEHVSLKFEKEEIFYRLLHIGVNC